MGVAAADSAEEQDPQKLSLRGHMALERVRDDMPCFSSDVIVQFLADRTATQYDRLLAAACCPSVCLFVCL